MGAHHLFNKSMAALTLINIRLLMGIFLLALFWYFPGGLKDSILAVFRLFLAV